MSIAQPLVSIVMPSMNQGQFIQESIQSVLDQDYDNLELIVQDGGSTDDTVKKLEALGETDQRIRWVSEQDSGPADALNRAFSKTRGEIIGWLNSDDLYAENAIATAVLAFSNTSDLLLVYGQGEYVSRVGDFIRTYPTRPPDAGLKGFESGCFINQPTVFFSSSVLTLLGGLDESLKTAFDYDYWIRAFKVFSERIGFVDSVLARSRLHEDCITMNMRAAVALEGLALGKKHLGAASVHWAASYLEELRREFEPGDDDFFQRAADFIRSAEAFLAPNDTYQLKMALNIS